MSINIGDLLGSLTGGSNKQPEPQPQAQAGGGGGGGNLLASLLPAVLPMLMNGGLTKILGGLQSKGLTEQVSSWESSDTPNEPVSPAQIKEVVGQEELDQVAQKAGVSTDEAASGLSQLLPQLVDKLSPQGQLPDEGGLGDLLGSLTKQIGR